MVSSTTYKDIFNLLQGMDGDLVQFEQWLEKKWMGKEKQETVLCIFSYLDLIPCLSNFNICVGNFNLFNFRKVTSRKEFFYTQVKEVKVQKGGDASDLTGIHKEDNNIILATTSKNYKNYTLGKLDIEKIYNEFYKHKEKNPQLELVLCICIRDKKVFEHKIKMARKTSQNLKDKAKNPKNIIIDWNDLKDGFCKFNENYGNIKFEDMIKEDKPTLTLKMHQQLGVEKTLLKKDEGVTSVLWGHIQRSGKSYIMAGCIIKDQKYKNKCNYLIITPSPNETIEQYINVLNCSQLNGVNIFVLNGNNKNPQLKEKNIIICSKQFLQKKSIAWLRNLKFDMRFLDESHYGGTTALAKNMLNFYGGDCFTVYITATYFKPVQNYQIPKLNWILWDIEDVHLCQNIDLAKNRLTLVEKHGDIFNKILNGFNIQNLKVEYDKYPNLWVLTQTLNEEVVKREQERMNDLDGEGHGYSIESCQLLVQDANKRLSQFKNPNAVLDMWKEVRKLLRRKKDICQSPEGGNYRLDEPEVIMTFLPQVDVDKISDSTIGLLKKNNLFSEYLIIKINSMNSNDPKKSISDAWQVAKNTNKQGVIVLSGRQCSMGISIPFCDVVILLNNNTSYDMINQMMFRSMTEQEGKKCGFVIDLNIHRVIKSVLVNYANQVKPSLPIKDGFKEILLQRLITINGDDWLESFGKNPKEIVQFCKYAYEIYITEPNKVLQNCIDTIKRKGELLTVDSPEFNLLKYHFNIKKTRNHRKIQEFTEGEGSTIDKGIKKKKNDALEDKEDKEDKDEEFNPSEIISIIVPLICLLTVDDDSSSFDKMLKVIEENQGRLEIFIEQVKIQGGKEIEFKILELFITLYIKYLKDDVEFKRVVTMIKEQFSKNLNNQKIFSKIVSEYIIPKNHEKKVNAEVSTPHFLRQNMLDKVPLDFWTSPKKVFEPCAGKGGFLIDVIDRFMIGLKDRFTDEKERYKVIVEECLYFADINPLNIFVNKLLIDPWNNYKLNYYQGDTLKLDMDKWGHQFDLVVGNPPYNDASGNKGKGHTLWTKFIECALDKWVKKGGFLLYVNPSLWRQVDHPLQMKMKTYQIHYLEIHNQKDGMKTFKCNTRYDWYLIEKLIYQNPTTIKTEKGDVVLKDLRLMNFIPNYNFDLITKLTNNEEKVEIIHSRSAYGADKKWVQKNKSDGYKFPVIYTVNQHDQPTIFWSNKDGNGMFGTSKLIFGNGANGFVVDKVGEFGLTQWATAIVDNPENLITIKKALKTKSFKEEIVFACTVSKAEMKVLKYFNKDFWKEFI